MAGLTWSWIQQSIAMSEPSFEFSFSLSQSPAKGSNSPGCRVLAWPFDAFAATPGEVLVHTPHDQGVHRLQHEEVSILQRCEPMRTLEQHADAILSAAGGGTSRVRLVAAIDRLADRGLLASEQGIRERFAKSRPALQRAPISSLFIRSCGRPRALKRALESILRQEDSGLSTCLVIDDSRDSAMRRQIETLVEEAAGCGDIRMVHLGPAARDRLVSTLAARGGISRQRLDWFVNGHAGAGQRYGCGINLALLLAAGTRFALLDDDASLEAFADTCTDASQVAELTDGHDIQPGFPEAGERPSRFRELTEFSPLRQHAAWLGATLGEMLAGCAPAEIQLAGLTSRSLADMQSQGRVRFTVNGVFGDPGTRSPRWIHCRPAEQLTELMTGEERYRALIERRWMTRRESRLRAVLGFTLMTTTLTGVDNSSIMLPTLPNGAGEDAFLGEIARFLEPGSMQVGMPWMLSHQPETRRCWRDADLAQPVQANPGLFFRHLLIELAESAGSDDTMARAGLLGTRLADLAATGPRELASAVFRQVMSARSELAGLLQRRTHERALPDYLVRDYRRMIEVQLRCARVEDVVPEALVADIRNIAAAYAAGMDDWINAWNTARRTGQSELVDEILRS